MKSTLAKALFASAMLLCSGGVVQAELIAYYTFEGNANDVSGNGNDGVASNVSTVPGYEGQAYYFIGGWSDTGSHVDIPSLDINPAVLPQLTMGAWVKWGEAGYCRQQVITHDDGGYDRSLGIDCRFSSGLLRWSAFNGAGGVASTIEPTQEWTFLAIVYDQTTSSATLYVNGDSFPTPTYFGPGETYTAIGRNPGELGPGESGEYFVGAIDNLFFFDEALTAEQIADIRANGVPSIDQMIASLYAKSIGVGPGSSLANKAVLIQTYFGAGDTVAACEMSRAYLNELNAQAGKKHLSIEQAEELAAIVERIMLAMACD